MATNLILGTQWGDEGKAKVIDYMAEKLISLFGIKAVPMLGIR